MSTPAPRPSDLLADFLRPAFLVRLTLAYVAVAALLMLAEPLLGAVMARGARDLILLTSALPYLDSITWSGENFRVTTHLLGGHLSLDRRGYWFMVAFPVGFAIAVPGLLSLRGVVRLLAVTGISIAFAMSLLAIAADGLLSESLWDVRLRVNPPWRDMLVRTAMRRFWDFAALMYQFAACLAVAWASMGKEPSSGSSNLLHWTTLAALLAGGIFLLAADRAAENRRVASERELRPALEVLNPKLFGHHLLMRAKRLEQQGHLAAAAEACTAA